MKPAVLVARAVFADIVESLRMYFDVDDNPHDRVLTAPELSARLQGKVGLFATGSEGIDEALDSLTAAGKKRLAQEAREWRRTADLMAAFLAPREEIP